MKECVKCTRVCVWSHLPWGVVHLSCSANMSHDSYMRLPVGGCFNEQGNGRRFILFKQGFTQFDRRAKTNKVVSLVKQRRSTLFLFICLSLSVFLSVCLPFCLSPFLSVSLSLSLFLSLSVSLILSVCL